MSRHGHYFREFAGGVGVGTGEDAVFDVARAVQTPVIGGNREGEKLFERGGGLEAFDDAFAELL